MEKKKVTVPQIKAWKGQSTKFTLVTAYDVITASVIDKTSIEMILCGDSVGMCVYGYESTVPVTMDQIIQHTKAVVNGAPNTFIVGDLPFGSYNASVEEAVRNSNRILKEGGADCVKLEGGKNMAQTVASFVNGGIPVLGHIGLTPQTAGVLGGFKVQARDSEAAKHLLEDAKALERAGVFGIVVECVPVAVGKMLTEEISVPIMGAGAGPHCDCQIVLTVDLLGLFDRFTPKFAKQYVQFNKQMLDAYKTFYQEVQDGVFPGPEHCYGAKE